MTGPQIRLAIVDDHAIVREGLKMLLSHNSSMAVVGEASTREEAIELVRQQQPDVVLLDLVLGGTSGEELIPELRDVAPACVVLVLTGIKAPERHKAAILKGARGVVAKESAADVLVKAVRKVHEGEVWLERIQMGSLLAEMVDGNRRHDAEAQRIATLTAREREVIALVGQGLRNEEIGARLSLREKTVRNHLTSVYDKLGVKDRLELAIYAHRRRLASFDGDGPDRPDAPGDQSSSRR